MRRQHSSLASITTGCDGRAGAKGKGARVAAFTGRRYPLLSPAPPQAMLVRHAQAPLYLNVARVRAGTRRHGVKVGRRERDDRATAAHGRQVEGSEHRRWNRLGLRGDVLGAAHRIDQALEGQRCQSRQASRSTAMGQPSVSAPHDTAPRATRQRPRPTSVCAAARDGSQAAFQARNVRPRP